MSDDANSKVMAQFIEKATPKLLEAMQDGITKAVETQISGLKENTTKMLDELKDAQRATGEKDTQIEELKKLIESTADDETKRKLKSAGGDNLFTKGEDVMLTREQARDPAVYKAAKAQAAEAGVTVQILRDA